MKLGRFVLLTLLATLSATGCGSDANPGAALKGGWKETYDSGDLSGGWTLVVLQGGSGEGSILISQRVPYEETPVAKAGCETLEMLSGAWTATDRAITATFTAGHVEFIGCTDELNSALNITELADRSKKYSGTYAIEDNADTLAIGSGDEIRFSGSKSAAKGRTKE